MKALTNVLLFAATTCAILVVFGVIAKFYWTVFMFGWGLI